MEKTKFIPLTYGSDTKTYVRTDAIVHLTEDENMTSVYISNSDCPLRVKESVNEILEQINGTVPEKQTNLLDKVKKAREEIEDRIDNYPDRNISEYEDCLEILDKLIKSEELVNEKPTADIIPHEADFFEEMGIER